MSVKREDRKYSMYGGGELVLDNPEPSRNMSGRVSPKTGYCRNGSNRMWESRHN